MSITPTAPRQQPLSAATVRHILNGITGLSSAQSRTSHAIADLLGPDGTAPISSVLSLFEGADPRGALRQFKSRFNKVSSDELELVFDGRKQNNVWFVGTNSSNDIFKKSPNSKFFAQNLFERARLSDEKSFVTSNVEIGSFKYVIDKGSLEDIILYHKESRDTVPAVDRLVEWANNREDKTPRLCALLGDLGTGKTTTSILLTQELLARHEAGRDVPLPIYFDLRDLDVDRLPDFGLRSILEQMLRQSSPAKIDVDNVLAIISTERCLVIFDGLDEVLVHLDQGKGQKLTRGLLQVIDPVARNNSGIRLMITCRNQYFRSVKDEIFFFLERNRKCIHGEDYLVLIMSPFNEEQILEYLEHNVPGSDPRHLLDAINSVHDLRSLARQPVLLAMIREVLPYIEESLMRGHRLHSVDLYDYFIDRWLERDNGKHTLLPAHKHRLMVRLAHDIWTSGRRTWSAEWMEDWLLKFLYEHPEMELEYSIRMPTQWKQDFRTATFISRHGNYFTFSHSSFLEYFLAKTLTDALLVDDENEALIVWDIPQPSRESLIFFGEMLDRLDSAKCRQAFDMLTKVAHSGSAQARTTLFAYLLLARSKNFPTIPTQTLNLSYTNLQQWELGSEKEPLDLTGVPFTGSRLDGAVLTRVKLNHANMTGASFVRTNLAKCSLISASLNDCDLSGAIFRHCDLTEMNIEYTKCHRTQFLFCHPVIKSGEALVAPALNSIGSNSQALTVYPNLDWISCVTWSPDGTRILTAGSNGARLWDAATGETTHTLTTDWTDSAEWSPDGTRILTAGSNSIRMWNATTGQPLGIRIDLLPEGALLVRDAATLKVIGASSDAWRWLGYEVMVDGKMTRLPAEINGPLPPLSGADF